MVERRRGRHGQRDRQRRLAAEPLCRHCKANGIITAAVTPDHIVPLFKGGLDVDSNIQCLCEPCHSIKTAEDMGTRLHRRQAEIGADGWPKA
ncbi:HNH endonuclease [Sphingomonas azotifigens]|uniref:HNH endonuclease n=1 Tax=Sphingomonas azotifigens TaxID=330920 RepID=UPI0009FDC058|nr:HNH endonuclease signature motif containing protein [Sphingomonas azotifigens]